MATTTFLACPLNSGTGQLLGGTVEQVHLMYVGGRMYPGL